MWTARDAGVAKLSITSIDTSLAGSNRSGKRRLLPDCYSMRWHVLLLCAGLNPVLYTFNISITLTWTVGGSIPYDCPTIKLFKQSVYVWLL